MLLYLGTKETHSSIAQSVEHAAVNRRVVGSSPTWGATKLVLLYGLYFFEVNSRTLLTDSFATAAGGGCREQKEFAAVKIFKPEIGRKKFWEPQSDRVVGSSPTWGATKLVLLYGLYFLRLTAARC